MSCPRVRVRSARRSRAGQSVVEYALLLAAIGLAAVVALSGLQSRGRAVADKLAMAVARDGRPGGGPAGSDDHSSHSPGQQDDEGDPPEFGRVLYRVKESATAAEHRALDAVVQKYALQEDRKVVRGKVSRGRIRASLGAGPEAVCLALRDSGAVEFAEPDRLVAPSVVPDDASYGSQWFHRTIDSPAAWDVTVGSSTVIVAVCDTGVNSAHPDLAANLMLPGYNSVDGSTDTEPVMGHGTSTAGCIGAVGNNGTGVSGVNWHVSILPVRVTNRSDGYAYYSDLAEGIRWAADHGARVVNLSYDGAGSSTINYAGRYLRERGGLLFIAAGNSARDGSSTYPDSPDSLAVGATTSSDTRASYSNYGTYIDLVAPGSGIYTTTPNGYASVSGTSFASPIAAGVAALIFAVDPSLSPAEAESCLLSTCVDLGAGGDDSIYGHGRVDAAAAVAAAANTTPPVPNEPPTAVATASPSSGTAPLIVTFDGSGSSDSDGTITSYTWYFGDGGTGLGAVATHTYGSEGTYTARLTVTDDDGATASDTVTVTVAAPEPDPPPNTPPTAVAVASPASGTAPLDVRFDAGGSTDSDGAIASYAWYLGDGTSAVGRIATHTYDAAGTYTARLIVTDDDGATASDTVTVTVAPAGPRHIHVGGISIEVESLQHGAEITATVLVVDADGAPVSGAKVEGEWSGVVRGKDRVTSGSDGNATFRGVRAHKAGDAILTVTDVGADDCIYEAGQNVQSSCSTTVAGN